MALPISAPETTITTKNLTRLLTRLDSKLTNSKEPLNTLDRARFTANLEYARQLLLSLESQSTQIRNTPARQSVLSGLGVQKQVIRRLNETLHVTAAEDEEDEEDSTYEDVEGEGERVSLAPIPASPDTTRTTTTTATTTSTLRNRFPSTHLEKRKELFNTQPEEHDVEKKLDLHRAEQENITTDMLSLAQALKQSSLRFGTELENEKALLDMAREGLDKNALGLEGTGRKLDTLRKNESVGFLWSILYPIITIGLALLILFVMLFAPKLRW